MKIGSLFSGYGGLVPNLNRNAQLKALGNGVVPQQAHAALTQMLNAQAVAA
jgi:DNA (cytosine-5)-methyltransferase 1